MITQRSMPWYSFLFACIVSADQLSKYYMLISGTSYTITSFLSLQVQLNRGISWGMFHSENDQLFFFITFLICCFIGGFMHHTFTRFQEGYSIYAEVSVIAGAFSNVFDRFFHGGVIDFIFFSWRTWSFPLFNIADVAIVVGIFFILLEGLREQ